MMVSSHDNFNRNFLISLGLHAGLLLLGWIGGKTIATVFKNNDVEIIKSAVRVDVVGMPKLTIQELKQLQNNAAPAEPEVVKGPKEDEKPKEDDTPDEIKKDDLVIQEAGKVEKKKKKSSFLSIVNEAANKKVEKKKGTETGKGNKNLDSLILEGNRLSKGSALVGDFSGEAATEFGAYVQALPDHLRKQWRLPSFLMNKDLKCRIRVNLSSSGKLIRAEIVESSGNPDYDRYAMRAVNDSDPFPKPSDAVGPQLSSRGIILGFPL